MLETARASCQFEVVFDLRVQASDCFTAISVTEIVERQSDSIARKAE